MKKCHIKSPDTGKPNHHDPANKPHQKKHKYSDGIKKYSLKNGLILPILTAFSIVILHISILWMPTPGHQHHADAAEIASVHSLLKTYDRFILGDQQIEKYNNESIFVGSNDQIDLSNENYRLIVQAVRDIDQGNWAKAQKDISDMESRFGRRLFNWLWLTKYDDNAPFGQASTFLSTIPDWPDQYTIRRKIEKSFDHQKIQDIRAVVQWLDDNPPLTPEGYRFYIHYLDQLGEKEKAKTVLNDFWATTLLSSQNQKYFYKNYKSWITDNANHSRLDRLLFGRQYTNARNLATVMGSGYKKLVEARIALAEGKNGVDWFIGQVPASLQNDPGLNYERLRWRRKKNLHTRAIEILNYPPEKQDITNPKDWWMERHIMARRLIEVGEFKTAYSLTANHRQEKGFSYAQAEWLSGWLALNFLNKPVFAFEHFQNLYTNVETPISRARGAYWSGKAQEELGQIALAAKWYDIARRHGATFYGQLAATSRESIQPRFASLQINPYTANKNDLSDVTNEAVSYAIDFPNPAITFEAKRAFSQHEMVIATKILHEAGLRDEAGDFLDALGRKAKHPSDYRLIADFAQELNLTHKALNIAKYASYKGTVLTYHQFPVLYELTSDIDNVELALIHGIMRQESAFNTQAKSRVGARGLMQLMPATAKGVARKNRVKYSKAWLTSRPAYNIQLGTFYLEELLKRYDNSYVLAIAAYNAGPGRVSSWLKIYGDPRENEVSWIDWIELIPIYETRNYVQRVLEAVYVYRSVLSNTQNIGFSDNMIFTDDSISAHQKTLN